jgi:hypothetical protein
MKKASIVVMVLLGIVLLLPVILFLIVFLSSVGLFKLVFEQVVVLLGFVYWPLKFIEEFFKFKINVFKYGNEYKIDPGRFKSVKRKKAG